MGESSRLPAASKARTVGSDSLVSEVENRNERLESPAPLPSPRPEALAELLIAAKDVLRVGTKYEQMSPSMFDRWDRVSDRLKMAIDALESSPAPTTESQAEAPHHEHCPERSGGVCICGRTFSAVDLSAWGKTWAVNTREVVECYGPDQMIPSSRAWMLTSARHVELMAGKLLELFRALPAPPSAPPQESK